MPASRVADRLGVTLQRGLSNEAAAIAQAHHGLNTIEAHNVHWSLILARQFKSPFIYLLVAASILAFIFGEAIDGGIIFLFLFINAALGFVQEYRSERVIELLRQYTTLRTKVLRNGVRVTLPSEHVVVGDIVFLETGDRIPADLRFFETRGMRVDESVLTGESAPICKSAELTPACEKADAPALTIGFSGTTVVSGSGSGVVVATGGQTIFGEIASLTMRTSHVSGFEKGITRFSSFILKLVLITIVFIFVANIILKGGSLDWSELILFSIALAVGVIPEALPVVTTFSLSHGARRLARKKVVVKRLSAIEDLGGIEVLCTDKTGTITKNALTYDGLFPGSSARCLLLANLAGAQHFAKRIEEPFDFALRGALKPKERASLHAYERCAEMPFDPETRLNAVCVSQNKQRGTIIIRGALESVLAHTKLSARERLALYAWSQQVGRAGRRVIAVASRPVALASISLDTPLLTGTFSFAGAVAFVDPIKSTTHTAVSRAAELGIAIKIITGDGVEVAGAVAHEIGLITSPENVIAGDDFAAMPYEKRREIVLSHAVFARVTPTMKHDIIKLLQETKSVGFLGEGINDAPALKVADVSLVVHGAADIAKEAADIVLLQKSLHVIIDGIHEGRSVFSNTVKYIRATLASNFGNFYAVAVVSLFIPFLPMLPIQILLLNLLSDVPLIMFALDRVDASELTRPTRYDMREVVWIATLLGIVSTVFDFIFFSMFFQEGSAVLQTNWFLGSLLTELVFVFSIRSILPFYKASRPAISIVVLTGVAAIAGLALPFMTIGQQVFRFVPPTSMHIVSILFVVVVYFISTEVVKSVYRRYSTPAPLPKASLS